MATLIFCGILSFFSIWASIRVFKENKKFRSWSESRARFIHKSVADYSGPGADIGDVERLVEYDFLVNGVKYTSKNIYVIGRVGKSGRRSAEWTKKFLDELQDGMIVRYNPANPGEAALFPFPMWGAWITLTTGIVCFFATLIMLLNL